MTVDQTPDEPTGMICGCGHDLADHKPGPYSIEYPCTAAVGDIGLVCPCVFFARKVGG